MNPRVNRKRTPVVNREWTRRDANWGREGPQGPAPFAARPPVAPHRFGEAGGNGPLRLGCLPLDTTGVHSR